MNTEILEKYRIYIIAGIIAAFSLLAFWLRMLPAENIVTGTGVNLLGIDPWYNLRQVEATVANFPGYGWFDPMTEFPHGNVIHWGPLFIHIISVLCILAGAATRPEIMYVASIVPALMGMAMVPLLYAVGHKIADWKCGLLTAGFGAVVSGLYFYRSLFGFVDHHIAETLFSTLFCLAFIIALSYMRTHPLDLKELRSFRMPLILAFVAGIAYLLGLFVMPTMILFAMIVAIYTPLQFIWDHFHDRNGEELLLLNTVVFSTATIGLLLFGFNVTGTNLSRYSVGHVYAYLAIIIATLAIYGIARYLDGRPKYLYPVSLAGLGIIGMISLAVASPELYNVLISNLYGFFGQPVTTTTIQEARAWVAADAWSTYHYGLILMAGGLCALCWKFWRNDHSEDLFVLVWSLIILISTIQHVRYEYYLAANVALLSGLAVWAALEWSRPAISALITKEEKPQEKSGKKKPQKKPSPDPARLGIAAIAVILALLFAGTSLSNDITAGTHTGGSINSEWMEGLEWMGENLPDNGVDYYATYDADEKQTFTYPPEAYGIMSWWDYGHWITYISKGIPNANPFQHGVAGQNGAAAFFVQQSEEKSSEILDNQGTRFVVTDVEMDTQKFWAMATWYNKTAGIAPYIEQFINPTANGQYEVVKLYSSNYFRSMTSRLHNFDGSMVEPEQVFYVEYMDAAAAGASVPVVRNGGLKNHTEAEKAVSDYNAQAAPGYHAAIMSSTFFLPTCKVPALHHYRLVHESPRNALNSDLIDIKYVKVFEYVKGAHIRGEGTIEVQVMTDTGRTFTYRQESTDGEFIVPYPTSGSSYDVRATGEYRIVETGKTFSVPESAVMDGSYIN